MLIWVSREEWELLTDTVGKLKGRIADLEIENGIRPPNSLYGIWVDPLGNITNRAVITKIIDYLGLEVQRYLPNWSLKKKVDDKATEFGNGMNQFRE